MKRSITITGALGSGKSTVAKKIANDLGLIYYSTGQAQRAIAQRMGITTLKLNKLAETDKSIDDKIDGVIKKMNNDGQLYVVDSRLAWYFMPASLKIKLNVSPEEAAKRIFNDTLRQGEKNYNTEKEVLSEIRQRRQSERERFLQYYHIDIEDESNFDLIIDTTNLTIDEVCNRIYAIYNHIS